MRGLRPRTSHIYKRTDFPVLATLLLWHEGKTIREIAIITKRHISTIRTFLRDLDMTRDHKARSALRYDRR